MSKLIDADTLKNVVWQKFNRTYVDNHLADVFVAVIDEMPPAEGFEEVKQGVWLYTEAEGGLKYWLCSNCRKAYWRKNPKDMLRCYYCGSHNKMER